MNHNEKKSDQLGMAHGTACGILRKQILFAAIQQLGRDVCYRCDKKITSIDEFSIDHKTAWMDSDDPQGLFFDLDNISFSHLKCNISIARPNHKVGEQHHRSKLTVEAVKEIRGTHRNTKALAAKFGVHVSTIRKVREGRVWKHV